MEDICNCLLSRTKGGSINLSNNILDIINKNKKEWEQAFKSYHKMSKKQILNYLNNNLEGGAKERDIASQKSISEYTIVNIIEFLETDKGLFYKGKKKDQFGNLVNKKLFEYDPYETAFERNYDKYRDYQQRIIKNWAVSAQELLILYFGVGTGKTIIATTCAEEFTRLNPQSFVYFILPASLVLNTIGLMFHYGIDPTIKRNGEYIYNFASYQQMIRTKYDFKDNSLMIIDEIHNLRNLISKKDKVRKGLKWTDTGNVKLEGNVLTENLIKYSGKVIKKLFMTGTLFVNSPYDLETVISLGYNKIPLVEYDMEQMDNIMYKDEEAFKNYYQGLISFYRIGGENLKMMPKVEYHFTPIITYDDPTLLPDPEEDPFLINTRTFGSTEKVNWVIDFLKEHKNEKSLIYVQFLDKQISILTDLLTKNKIPYNLISGELSKGKKQEVIDKYNTDKIKLIIFSLAIKEGISFKETNNFIVFTPYWNYAITEQVIARAIRLDSHKMGNKSKVDVYLPIMNSLLKSQTPQDAISLTKPFIDKANEVMNKIGINNFETIGKQNIKDYFNATNINVKRQRDIDMYLRMFGKMNDINTFEKRLLKLPSFDDVNNIENNEFIKVFNQEILDMETEGKFLSKEKKLKLKQKLYQEFYKKYIIESNKNLDRLSTLIEIKDSEIFEEEVKDMRAEIRKALKEKKPLDYILSLFNFDKETIQKFNAFFTPSDYANYLIELSGIKYDNKENIKILEPTAGIGNLIGQLLTLPNSANYMIDCVEINKVFHQIGGVIYENINNVIWTNADFLNYASRYNYDYIFMNPPFNIKTKNGNKHDIDFVVKAYNMLNDEGVLVGIISSKFTYDSSTKFKRFKKLMEDLKANNKGDFIELNTGFRAEERVAKEMRTDVSMYYIRLDKIPDFIIDLNVEKEVKVKKQIDYEYVEETNKIEEVPVPVPEPVPEPEPKPKKKPSKELKDCPPGKIRNPRTNRCVKVDGAIGKKILKGEELPPKPPKKPKEPKPEPPKPAPEPPKPEPPKPAPEPLEPKPAPKLVLRPPRPKSTEEMKSIVLKKTPKTKVEIKEGVVNVKQKRNVKEDLLTIFKYAEKLIEDYKNGKEEIVEVYTYTANKIKKYYKYYNEIEEEENRGVDEPSYDNSMVKREQKIYFDLIYIINKINPPPPPPPPKIYKDYDIDPKEKPKYRKKLEEAIIELKKIKDNKDKTIVKQKLDEVEELMNIFEQIKYNDSQLKFKDYDKSLKLKSNLILTGISNRLK